MIVHRDYRGLPATARGMVLAIGNFDGVHRGHQIVIGEARAVADAIAAPLGAMAFEPHPRQLFRPDDPPFRLTPFEERARLFQELGVDVHVVPRFDRAFSELSAEAFIEEILVGELAVRHVAIGYDFCFGNNRRGTAEVLVAAGRHNGFGVTIVTQAADEVGGVYSSSRHAAMDDHLVADLDVGDVLADGVDDARGVAAADVEVFLLTGLVARLDDVDRDAEGGPDIVVVDPGGHDVDQGFVVGDLGNRDHLLLEADHGFAEPFRTDQPGVHVCRDDAERRRLAHRVEIPGPSIHHRHIDHPPIAGSVFPAVSPGRPRSVCPARRSGRRPSLLRPLAHDATPPLRPARRCRVGRIPPSHVE